MDVKEKNNTEKTNAAAEFVAEDLNEVMRIRREKLAALVAEGKNVVFDVDVVGGINIKKFYGDRALSIFIQPPSVEVLRQRLTDRGTVQIEQSGIRTFFCFPIRYCYRQ